MYGWTKAEILKLTLNDVRIYVGDEKNLSSKMTFSGPLKRWQHERFVEATKQRIADLKWAIVNRIMRGS